ncbi:hypothetical protein [Novosphingobium sp. CCH12-A3]|uniref:hypothetical protein n=1 Tax=Novosphingobium sp. CCH12-A3 TaxID=1768752 RepID=UPI000A8D7EB4|nr:hypothetical protein [Novosphingobium sp. CCH12-A3]
MSITALQHDDLEGIIASLEQGWVDEKQTLASTAFRTHTDITFDAGEWWGE